MFTALPEIRYSWITLRQLCGRIRRQAPVVELAGLRMPIQYIFPDYLPGELVIHEHTHPFYEAHLILAGEVMYLSGTPQHLYPGHIFIQPPKTPHTWQVLEKPCLDLNFGFYLEPETSLALPELWPACPELFWEIALLLHDADEEGAGWRERATTRLTTIFSYLLASLGWPERRASCEEEPPQLVAIIEQYLLEHLDASLSLNDIAAAVGLRRRTLSRYFRRQTGASVMDYLRRIRLQSAVGLLINTDLSIAAIGRNIGMPEISYFCRCFRRQTGMTPQAYRHAHRAPLSNG